MVLFWEFKFFDLMVRHHAGVVSENNKRGWNFANSHTIRVAKTKALISFAVTAKLICAFVFAYANCWFSHEAAHISFCLLCYLMV